MKWAIRKMHPGELLRCEVYPEASDELRLALDNEFALVMEESKPIDENGAKRLCELLGTSSPSVWLGLQAAYDGELE